jgi:Tol biopolymer transport system component
VIFAAVLAIVAGGMGGLASRAADGRKTPAAPAGAPVAAAAVPVTPHESKFLSNVRQITSGFPKAGEAYFSPDGRSIVFQAVPLGYPFYQIYTQQLDDPTSLRMVSTGRGRCTCAYFSPDGSKILFASSHTDPQVDVTEKNAREAEIAARGQRRAYKWDFDPHMDIYTVNLDGTGLTRLTDAPGYDAEGSYSPDGSRIVFTSMRDGDDQNLFIMDADGGNVRPLTTQPGYDGGPFFSPDGRWIIFRSDRQKKDYLQLYAISVDGRTEVQLTHDLGHVEWCPYWHPSGKYIIWAGADYTNPAQRNPFHLHVMRLSEQDGRLVRGDVTTVTDSPSSDVLPVFSPDGRKLMWTGTRTSDRSSQVFLADWTFE